MDSEAVVEGDGYYGLHRALVEEFADFDVCDLHVFFLSSDAKVLRLV